MKNIVKTIQDNIKIRHKFFTIDNLIFKLHYRFTTIILLVLTLLLTTQELLGEHIKCINDKGVPEPIMNRFCFFSSTFTVVKYMNDTLLDRGDIPHPGVGALGLSSQIDSDEIKHHAYYQWVPFVLTLQAVMFYVPHLIWKKQEGDRMKKLALGLENAAFATTKSMKIGTQTVPTIVDVQAKFDEIKKYFKLRLIVNRSWTFWLISCELMNLFNVIGNIFLTNAFLGGQFLSLGPKIIKEGLESSVDPLDVVFPKMTKCIFYKYGASGSIQAIDALCVMALNILNEKLYMFLWFWYMFLMSVSIMGVIWRLLTFFLHSRSRYFNKMVFSIASSGKISAWQLMSVVQNCNFNDWLFLVYLAKNMDSVVFIRFFNDLSRDLNPKLNEYYEYDLDKESSYSSEEEKIMRESPLYTEVQKTKEI